MLIRIANVIIDADMVESIVFDSIGNGDDGAVIQVLLKRKWWQRPRGMMFQFSDAELASEWMDRIEDQLV